MIGKTAGSLGSRMHSLGYLRCHQSILVLQNKKSHTIEHLLACTYTPKQNRLDTIVEFSTLSHLVLCHYSMSQKVQYSERPFFLLVLNLYLYVVIYLINTYAHWIHLFQHSIIGSAREHTIFHKTVMTVWLILIV